MPTQIAPIASAASPQAAARGASIWTVLALALLAFAATLAWVSVEEREQAIEHEYRALESNARIGEAQVSGLLRNLEQFLSAIAREQKTLTPAQRASYDAVLAERKKQFPEIRSLVVIDAKGTVEFTATPKLKGFDSSQRDYFVAHLAKPLQPNFYVSRTFKTASGKDMGIAFSVAIYDSEQRFRGMVASGIDPKYFESVLNQILPQGAGVAATLFNNHGDLVFRVPNPERFQDISIAGSGVFKEYIASGRAISRHIGVSATDGSERIYAISRVGNTGLGVSVSRPFAAVLTHWWRNTLIRIAIFVVVAAVVLALGLVAQRRQRQHRQAEDALRESETAFRKLFEDSSDAILLIDATGVFVECNQAALTLLKMTREEFLGSPPVAVSPEFQPDGRRSDEKAPEMIALAYSKGLHRFDWTHVDAEGGEFIVEVSLMPIAVKGQTMLHTTWRDITARVAAADQIEHLAFYDALTDLPNRRLVRDRLQQALISSARHNRYGALMLLDMDDFKTLNDTLGHDVGDRFLVEVANRLRACVREGDTVARHGGDEFVVILKDFSGDALAAAQAESVAVKILGAVSQPYELDLTLAEGPPSKRSYHCTSSIGITLFRDQVISVDELMKRADTAMYQAKAAGRNALRFFDPEMQAVVAMRAALDNDLREAVRDGQFSLYYQVQVDSAGNRTGAEALLRWRHPRRGMVSPLEFIPQSEATGLILPIGHWVLETACAQLVAWAATPATSHLTLAVNVSARQFRHVDFAEQVLAIIDSSGANPKKLKLELTESLLLEDVEDVIAKMSVLKTAGIGFSLDDFGTGYSSLSYLKRLPLDQLKIDRSFVSDVLTDPNDAAIARTIVALAQSMGLAVIAEGVETEPQREFLAAHGCTAYQGYLFGRPLPIEEFSPRYAETAMGI